MLVCSSFFYKKDFKARSTGWQVRYFWSSLDEVAEKIVKSDGFRENAIYVLSHSIVGFEFMGI